MKEESYHFIGIGGIGMSALAQILLDRQAAVSGSDLSHSYTIEELKKKGATLVSFHDAASLKKDHTVIFSSSIGENNPELVAAKNLGCKILHRSELLALLMQDKPYTLAVAGTHGKTTVSALLAHTLVAAGRKPSFAIGGLMGGINGQTGEGPFFIAEADESDGSFLNYHPQGAIVTNVEADHMDFFKNEEKLWSSFAQFFQQVQNKEWFFYGGDDPYLKELIRGEGISYGFSSDCLLRVTHFQQQGWELSFSCTFEGKTYDSIILPLVGRHNALNGSAVFGLALKLGLTEAEIKQAFISFPGTARRGQRRLEYQSVLCIDDYAHHPTEIAATLQGVREAVEERRVVAIFQPHRFTRTQDLFQAYASVFKEADLVYITDIYGAGEEPIEGLSIPYLADLIADQSKVVCHYEPHPNLNMIARPHDVLITLGAGPINRVFEQPFTPRKWQVGLIFGGKSCEHEISLRSARFVAASLNPDLYEVTYFGIDKKGEWLEGEEAKRLLEESDVIESSSCRPLLDPTISASLTKCEIFLPILHGTFGEDGSLQGFFEILGTPYVGPDYRSAAIVMDKILTKKLISSAGVPTPKDIHFTYIEWRRNKEALLKQIHHTLHLPLYVKPTQLGSSVGVTKIEEWSDLPQAIEKAFSFDVSVMVEEGIVGGRELEFAVLGNTQGYRVVAPPPGEKLAEGNFVDYEKKYGEQPVRTTLYPDLSPLTLKKGQEWAEKAYRAIGCNGLTRVDFLLDKQEQWWLFEMNAIPGLQKLSLFPKIWMREGLSGVELIDRLIILGFHRTRLHRRQLTTL